MIGLIIMGGARLLSVEGFFIIFCDGGIVCVGSWYRYSGYGFVNILRRFSGDGLRYLFRFWSTTGGGSTLYIICCLGC